MFKRNKRNTIRNHQTPGSITLLEHMSCKNGQFTERDILLLARKLMSTRNEQEIFCYLSAYILEVYPADSQTLIDVMTYAKSYSFQQISHNMNDLAKDFPKSLAVKFFCQFANSEKMYNKTCPSVVDKLQKFISWNRR